MILSQLPRPPESDLAPQPRDIEGIQKKTLARCAIGSMNSLKTGIMRSELNLFILRSMPIWKFSALSGDRLTDCLFIYSFDAFAIQLAFLIAFFDTLPFVKWFLPVATATSILNIPRSEINTIGIMVTPFSLTLRSIFRSSVLFSNNFRGLLGSWLLEPWSYSEICILRSQSSPRSKLQ